MGASASKQTVTNNTYSDILTSIVTESTSNCSLSGSNNNNVSISNSTVKKLKVQQITAASLECLMSSSKKTTAIADAANKVLNGLGSSLGGIALSQKSNQAITNNVNNRIRQYMNDKSLTNLTAVLAQNNNLEIKNSDVDDAIVIQKAVGTAKLVSDYFSEMMAKDGLSNDISNDMDAENRNQLADIVDSTGNAFGKIIDSTGGAVSGAIDSTGNVLMTPLYYIIGFFIILILIVYLGKFAFSSGASSGVHYREIPQQYPPNNQIY